MKRFDRSLIVLTALAALALARETSAQARFEISFSPAAHAGPITGRVYVAISRTNDARRTPIEQTGETGVPLFGVNVENLAAGAKAVIDARAICNLMAAACASAEP